MAMNAIKETFIETTAKQDPINKTVILGNMALNEVLN
jgi:hypothetical protein